jgi:O-antigen ligase
LIAVIPFGIYLVGTQQIKFDRKILVFGILLISLLVMLPFVPESVTTRLGTLGASIEAGDLGGRVELWSQTILIFSNHSLMGLGSGTLDSAIGSAAHNTFISVMTETGLIGFVFFLTILAIVFFQAMNVPNGNSGLWVAIFLTWVIGVSSLSWEFRKLTWLFLNFIVIEGSFTYEQLNIGLVNMKISKNPKQFLTVNEPVSKIEAG